jgi:hypothetical protein
MNHGRIILGSMGFGRRALSIHSLGWTRLDRFISNKNMTEKRRATSSGASDSDSNGQKRAKHNAASSVSELLDEPRTNTTMPETLSLPATECDTVKIVSWNVNSLPASMKKGFARYLAAEDAHIVCLQETKLSDATAMAKDKAVRATHN